MSDSSQRGKLFERKVQKMTSKILQLEVKRDSRSGAGSTHKADVRDRFAEIPLFIECKDQEKANIKADWRKANAQASYGQAPVVVFPDNEEVLVTMRYSDLLQIIRESMDWQSTVEAARIDYQLQEIKNNIPPFKLKADTATEAEKATAKLIDKKLKHDLSPSSCKNGHLADQYGYCMQKKCVYSRGYKPKKVKK